MDETSLTDFLGESAESEESEESEGSEESEENGETEETTEMETDDTTGAISTYGWTPDGTACESCGATVHRRWRDDEQLVCADCKSW